MEEENRRLKLQLEELTKAMEEQAKAFEIEKKKAIDEAVKKAIDKVADAYSQVTNKQPVSQYDSIFNRLEMVKSSDLLNLDPQRISRVVKLLLVLLKKVKLKKIKGLFQTDDE